jgi:Ca-activated chloride channel family protein
MNRLLSIVFATVSVPLSQTPPLPAKDELDVITTNTNLVSLNVSVTKKNHPITDLTVADFHITDAGALVKPEFFEARGPTSIVFVIDKSTSMRGTKWRNLISGMKDFLRKQPADTDYTLILFSDKPALISQAIDAKEFWNELSVNKPDGETALYDGLAMGLDQINCLTRHHKAVVLLSDGGDNKSKNDLTTIEQEVYRTHTTIYTVGILLKNGPMEQERDRKLLENLATRTGGLSFFPFPDQIEEVLSDINKAVASQYSFGYYAPNVGAGWRDVDVRLLRPMSGLTVRYPQRYLLK